MGLIKHGTEASEQGDEAVEVAGVSPNFVTTKLSALVNWGRTGSLWPMPFGTACCAIEFMATAAGRYDISRFGMERMAFSPRQSDVLICAGRLPFKLAPVIRRIWDQMTQPKWAISMGACASSGGFYRAYHVLQGVDKVVPVDVYVPGCPPTPEAVLDGSLRTEIVTGPDGLLLPAARIDEISEPFGNSVHQTRSA